MFSLKIHLEFKPAASSYIRLFLQKDYKASKKEGFTSEISSLARVQLQRRTFVKLFNLNKPAKTIHEQTVLTV
jgi:hypothetical protein